MQITSPSFADGGEIPRRHSLDGENNSPPLLISDVPAGTETLALIVEDIDSPVGVFTHWVVWNISPEVTEIAENSAPAGSEVGLNGFGWARYDGPAPPSGRHRYRFRLFALDTTLEASSPDRKDHVLEEMNGAIIAEAELLGRYAASDGDR